MNDNEKFIFENYQTMTQKEMAEKLGISIGGVEYYIRKNKWFSRDIFSTDDIQYMINNYQTMQCKDIADHLGFTERQIRGKLNNMGYTKNRKINDHYFDQIDTPLKAYFLGFIFADGWIVCNKQTRNYEFGMQLQSGDKYVLEKLNAELGGLNIIQHTEPCQREICGKIAHVGSTDILRVYSKNLVLGLMKNGIETNKTLKSTHPIITDEFFFDFLRGYIDGDGCYWEYKKHYYLHITCATDTILKYIQQILQQYNIETRLYFETDRKYRLMCVNITEMQKLIPLLYPSDDVFCLSRKYQRIKSYLGSAA